MKKACSWRMPGQNEMSISWEGLWKWHYPLLQVLPLDRCHEELDSSEFGKGRGRDQTGPLVSMCVLILLSLLTAASSFCS